MLAVPALALTGQWPVAAGLIVAERTGRAIRKPSTDAMLSFAGKQIGRGWVFGLNEALDQAGATIGPLLIAFSLFRHNSFQSSFAFLLIPCLITILIVCIAHHFFPHPHKLEAATETGLDEISPSFWLFVAAGGCVAAGFADFSLIAYHFQRTGIVSTAAIPIYYAVAMVMGAIGALIFGKLLDRIGLPVLFLAITLSAFFAPLVFLGGTRPALLGMVLWGVGMGAQGSMLRSVISALIPREKRATGFGIFDAIFGIAWFAGSWLMGILYERSITSLVLFSVLLQLLALPLFIAAGGQSRKRA
jgi:predicted MFS family arabinose efflux permease